MTKRLFVSNLEYSITDESLDQLFARCGNVVNTKVVIDRATGRSKGFGFVEMSTEEEASEAIRILNDQEILGRVIRVAYAMPERTDRDRGAPGGREGFSRRAPSSGFRGGERTSYGDDRFSRPRRPGGGNNSGFRRFEGRNDRGGKR